jgi:DNA-binding IclR family transcriptional regulator
MTETTAIDVRDGGGASETVEPSRSLVGRLGSIMDAFDHDRSVLTLVVLSRRSGLPKSTAHRLAEQLCDLGWLERDYRGYRVGMRLFELGGLAVGHHQLREAALPHLHALATRAGAAVQLGVLDGDEVVYLERALVGPYRLPTRPGARMPAYCTGLGKAMLAYDELAAEQVLDTELPSRTAATITSPHRLRDVLDVVRSTGVAYDLQESYEGMSCVAAPIRSAGRAIAAVSVTGPFERVDLEDLAGAVQRTATNIWSERFDPRPQASKLARTAPSPANCAS